MRGRKTAAARASVSFYALFVNSERRVRPSLTDEAGVDKTIGRKPAAGEGRVVWERNRALGQFETTGKKYRGSS